MNSAVKILFVAVLVTSLSLSGWGSQPDFTISLQSNQPTVKLGTEINVDVILTNTSNRNISFAKANGVAKGHLVYTVSVKDEKGNAVPARKTREANPEEDSASFANIEVTNFQVLTLVPGQTLRDQIVLSKLFDFSHPGKYTVRVQRAQPNNKILHESNAVTIIVEP
jgi:hypothetical protein